MRTVSLKHIVGIHCKEFSRKWDILVFFISNCETHRETFILAGPRHWEFPPPSFHFSGFFSPQILPFQMHNYSEGFRDWLSTELAAIESSTWSVLEVTNTSGTVRNCRAWNSPSLFKLSEFHYPSGITDWTPWRPSLTLLLAMKSSMWSICRLLVYSIPKKKNHINRISSLFLVWL